LKEKDDKLKENNELLSKLKSKVLQLNEGIERQAKKIRQLRNHLNYYTKKKKKSDVGGK
jgi:hypothetical protein